MNKECPRCHKEDEWIEIPNFVPLHRWSHPCGLEYHTASFSQIEDKEIRRYCFVLNLGKFILYWSEEMTFYGIFTRNESPRIEKDKDGHVIAIHMQEQLPIKDLPINITWERLKILLPFM